MFCYHNILVNYDDICFGWGGGCGSIYRLKESALLMQMCIYIYLSFIPLLFCISIESNKNNNPGSC